MNIAVVIPPYLMGEDGEGVVPTKAMLPVGPLAMATLLRQEGHEVSVADLVFLNDWQKALRDLSCPDILLLSCHTVRNIGPCRATLSFLSKQWGRLPYVVVGGNACVELGKADFASVGLKIDAVVRGYGHSPQVIKKILLLESEDIFGTPDKNFPLPALDLLPSSVHEAYLKHAGGKYPILGHGFGCLWQCAYCSAQMGEKWLPRLKESTIAEIGLAKELGYMNLWCVDNLILVDPSYTLWFDQVVAELGMSWSAMTRAELIVKQASLLPGLRALKSVAMGIESASAEQLLGLDRGAKGDYFDTCRQAFALVNSAGMESVAFVILDLPGSKETHFRDLLHILQLIQPTTVSWAFYNPPEKEVLKSGRPEQYGFYRWPFGLSEQAPQRSVQQAMILSGIYWYKWHLLDNRPCFENGTSFGVRFHEGTFFQGRTERSPIGDLWEMWRSTLKGGE